MTTTPVEVDPVTLEILRANLVAITDEMKTNLRRTAYNAIIYEAQDFTVGLFDRNGDTVSIGLGLPMFVGGLSQAIKAKIEHYGYDGIEPGDILLTNDAYIMGSHLNHMIFTIPIFADGEIVAFASSMAHWLDIGGVLGATTQDIYSEGLQVPIVKIFKRGEQDDEITRIIKTNVRFSELALGDLRAQVAAIRTGERRLTELVDRYGADTVTRGFELIYERSDALARHAVEAIPDGEYFAETSMDDDGVALGKPVPIKVRVLVEGDRMTIDLSEVSPQVAGYFNSGATAGRSAAQVAFKFLTSPHEYPVNEGSLRPVQIILPPGRVVSATKPAAMRWWMTYPITIIDCVFRALAQAVPGGTIAGHHADLAVITMYGTDPAGGRLFLYNGGAQGGGWGATAAKDGESATICINDGDTHNTPVEVTEAKYPALLVERYALRPDSAGPGRHRGGLGTVVDVRTEAPVRLNTFVERTRSAPWGIDGGGEALPNRISLITAQGQRVDFPNGKVDSRPVEAGDRVVVETGGGGGYGSPYERPAADVLRDVRAGYVSVEAAREHYGVALTEPLDGEPAVDEAATARLRTR
ncbi:hydantoinase B/oxoprolinase family protein [Streptomyces griseiscabiei]|uniref:Hydantoinase B/oxoprolinase family protein n=1 Tax=Streptomyces griseiscabiei TaxID=2993540 RepID=A0ABU4LGH7_9ACTN|nr:hydantoinase B/oxoprolinase family protein [Streptomyces griseiscabiei]MBZ3900383.1 hydantoinase B/oxoprolinase family protein [Streptomyces griseiscabiei]MDX2914551.1 hydantoinase B/oxoprolinase family protein [Streptomyces griseiscabiei]